MLKTIKVKEGTHKTLKLYQVENNLKTMDKAIVRLLIKVGKWTTQ